MAKLEKPAGIRINPLNYPNVKCDKCGNDTFSQNIILKKIPGLEVGTGTEDQILDLPVYVCSKCGAILVNYREMYKLEEFSEQIDKEEEKQPILLDGNAKSTEQKKPTLILD